MIEEGSEPGGSAEDGPLGREQEAEMNSAAGWVAVAEGGQEAC